MERVIFETDMKLLAALFFTGAYTTGLLQPYCRPKETIVLMKKNYRK